MKLSDALKELDQIAPPQHAESWDNVGLLVGDPQQDVSKAILCIDYTPAVAEEARVGGYDLVIAYHPPIFKPISRVTAGGATGLIHDAIRRGVAIYSPHTALDVAAGGTNDVLADLLGLVDRRPLKLVETKARQLKLVTFVPHDHLDAVSRAIFAAGAGWIGNYSSCSFRTEGTGTFKGEQGANPVVGQAGKLETTPEVKLEVVAPVDRIDTIVAALRASHPYEEPAFDLVQLVAPPEGIGIGRIGRFNGAASRTELIDRIKRQIGLDHLLVAGPTEGEIHSAAVGAGACGGELLDAAIRANVEFYLTGELRHHDALRAAWAGMTVVCTLHSNSERIALKSLADRLRQKLPAMAFDLSQADADPFRVM